MFEAAWQRLLEGNPLEFVAVALAIGYVVLAIRESLWCWPCALISTAIYVYLYFSIALISESLLNVYYMAMAVYGWYAWRAGDQGPKRSIRRWSVRRHAILIVITGALVFPWGYLMHTWLGADYPYLDAFTTLFAVVTTYLVARKVLENWLYWIVIDAVAIYLNYVKGLELTAGLFGLYVVLAAVGFWRWYVEYRQYPPQTRLVV